MKSIYIKFLAMLIIVLAPQTTITSVFAQAPQKMSYQAVIRDASNNLILNQAIGMRISVLQTTASGTSVYTETHVATTNANGLVSFEIGTGTTSDNFEAINWANGPYFLKTETDPAGGTTYSITGTSQLLSVPYALYAASSGSSSSSWGATGNAGIDTSINFIGTTDDKDIIIKRNNVRAGLLSQLNTSFGVYGLNTANEGFCNTAYGSMTLGSNTIGGSNTANGLGSLYYNTGGNENTAVGAFALSFNNWGNNNTANGTKALYNNRNGNNNTANGNEALYWHKNGDNNTAIGYKALYNDTIGTENTATGYRALYSNISGTLNTANGVEALFYNTNGINNTASGVDALHNNSSGSYNVANGEKALYLNMTGGYNTAIGIQSLYFSTEAYFNTAIGSGALYNATGGSNTAIGVDALRNVTTGTNNSAIGRDAQVPSATGSNQVRIGNSAITYAGVQVAWTISSDRRWKTDIKQSELGLNFIKKLKPVSYVRLNDESRKTEYGFIAQEVEELLTSVGVTNSGLITKDAEGMHNLRYNDLLAPMVKALQEQQEIIESLLKRIEVLENK